MRFLQTINIKTSIVILLLALSSYLVDQAYACDMQGLPELVSGHVLEIDTSAIDKDGPALVQIKDKNGKKIEVEIASCEQTCSPSALEFIKTLKVDDNILVRGKLSGGKILIFDPDDHELEKLS